jgi:upstream activation factor subunit UAF30
MPKQSSKSASKSESVSATPAVEQSQSQSQPVVEKKVKAPRTKKEQPVEAQQPQVPAQVPETVTTASGNDSTANVECLLSKQSSDFISKLNELSVTISNLKAEYRALEKRWTRELKTAEKVSSKRKRKSGNRPPSGFVKPTKISDELATFLGKDKGVEMARTDVTREINKYIRTHNLQDSNNGRKINPDSKLATLLKLKKSDELTYFNLQKYMSPHFAKVAKVATA